MPSRTSFGPQGRNATFALPAQTGVNRYGTGVDTWVKDASTPLAKDGTVLDAPFFNRLIGNLRGLIKTAQQEGAAIVMDESDMSLLTQAVKHFAAQGASSGMPTVAGLTAATAISLAPASDRLPVLDRSANVVGHTTPYAQVNAVLTAGAGITLDRNATTGKIVIRQTATLDYTTLGVLAALDGAERFAVYDSDAGAYRAVTTALLASYIVAQTFSPPISGSGYLRRDATGVYSFDTPSSVLPAAAEGFLKSTAAGGRSWVRGLELAGGTMEGKLDLGTQVLQVGRPTTLPAASATVGGMLYFGGTMVYSNGTNWLRVSDDGIVA